MKLIRSTLSLLLIFLLASLIVYVSIFGACSTSKTYLLGDVNRNGIVNISDATDVQCDIAKMLTLDEEQIYLANVDGMEGVNIKDATFIQMYIGKFLTDFPTNDDGYKIGDEVSFNNEYTVVFKDYDGEIIKSESVLAGESATAPEIPIRDGYVFVKWDKSFDNVTSNLEITAIYNKLNNPTVVMGSAVANPGDSVVIPIVIHNNPGINGMQLNVEYASGLKITKAEAGTALTALNLTLPETYSNPSVFLWDGMNENETSNGIVLKLTFTVPSDAEPGDKYAISITYPKGTIYDVDLNDVEFDTVDGVIEIKGKNDVSPTEATSEVSDNVFTVTFKDYDGKVIKTESVKTGESAVAPNNPKREGYIFKGWNKSFEKVTENLEVIATYTKIDKPTIAVDNVTAVAGEKVNVPIIIYNNPGINGIQLNVSYDSDLTLLNAANGNALTSLNITLPGSYSNPSKFLWDGLNENETGNGTVLDLTFAVPANAKSGDVYNVLVDYPAGAIYDVNLDDVEFETIDGIIEVL